MTLPFISYGGSSIISLAYGVGMMLALTRLRPRTEVESISDANAAPSYAWTVASAELNEVMLARCPPRPDSDPSFALQKNFAKCHKATSLNSVAVSASC